MRKTRNPVAVDASMICALLIIWAGPLWCGPQVFGQEKQSSTKTEVNNTYGEGGKEITTTTDFEGGTKWVETKVLDARGVLRHWDMKRTNPAGEEILEISDYDCLERQVGSYSTKINSSGQLLYRRIEKYRLGELDSAEVAKYDEDTRQWTVDKYEYGHDGSVVRHTQKQLGEEEKRIYEEYKNLETASLPAPDTSTCPIASDRNEVAGDFSIIREDAEPERFNTYGVNGSFTHYLNDSVGLTADFNAHFKKQSNADLSKISVLGGVTLVPFDGAKTTGKVTVSTHALFGVAHFSLDSGSSNSTDNAFAMKLGGAFDVNVSTRFFVRPIQIDYAPTFFGGNTQHNVEFGFGGGFRF